MKHKKKVILICEKISDRVILFSKVWKTLGYETFLIYSQESLLFKDLNDIDFVLNIPNPAEIMYVVKNIKSNAEIHYFNYSPDRLGLELLNSKISYMYDYKDLFWKVMSTGIPESHGQVEVEILKNAKLVTNRDWQVINYLAYHIPAYENSRLIYSPEYYVTEGEYEDAVISSMHNTEEKKLNAVITGGYSEDGGTVLAEGIKTVINNLLQQGIKVTVLGTNSNIYNINQRYKIDEKQIEKNENLIIKEAMIHEEFEKELINYDFAVHMTNEDLFQNLETKQFINSNAASFSGSARLISFIKANLPILISKRYECNINRFKDSSFLTVFDKNNDYSEIFSEKRKNNFKAKLFTQRKKYHLNEFIKKIENTLG
jgi:hypothetical protein